MTQERAILAGGCFWGMEGLIYIRRGIEIHPKGGVTCVNI